MKTILIHGNYIQKSYLRLSLFIDEAKKREWEVIRIDPKSSLDLIHKISTQSLFDIDKLLVIQNPKLIDKKGLLWLKQNKDNLPGTLVFYQEGNLAKSSINSLPKLDKLEQYTLPRNLFKFLESFYPGNSNVCLKLYYDVLNSEPVEFVFSLLSKQVRDLYWVLVEPSTIPYPSWRVAKLENQSKHYIKNDLVDLINTLSKLDIRTKTTKQNLTDSLDLLILTNLQ